jgi:hypothetical protein
MMQTLTRNSRPNSRPKSGIVSHLRSACPAAPTRPAPACDPVAAVDLDRGYSDVNYALVARVRAEIRRGVYDTERRFEIAVCRMLDSAF